MNDLERDLHELFRDKAGSIDTAPAAPADVLRRGRGRQIQTVFASGFAAIAAVAVVVAAVARFTGGPAPAPVTNPTYGERTATIHGITVTAPDGWTLIDDWPVSSLLPAASQTCSFSATGSPIGPSPVGGNTSSAAIVQPSRSCTTEPVPLPAGLPVLQLANFGSPLDGAVCHVGDLRPIDLPADGVAAYVAAFPQGMKTEDFLAACPGGGTVTTFADRGFTTAYAAVSLIGPDASQGDVTTVERFMNSLGGLRVPTDEPATASPGYVVAAGVDGGTTWRLEAGFPFPGSGSGIGATLITTDTDGHETASAPVPPADMNETPIEQTERLVDGSGSLMWGTASTLVRTITSVASDGSGTDATLMGWPDGMRATTRVTEQSQLDGSIWFAIVPEIGQLQVNAPDSVSPSSLPLAASALDYHVAGDTVVATGNDLGHEWMLRLQGGALTLSLDGGASLGTFSATEQGDGGLLNVPGGAFLFSIEPRDVGGLQVSSDVSGSVTIASGRWMPAGSDLGRDGRVWVVALPGSSTGFVQVEGRSPMAFSWPTSGVPAAGQVLRSGSDDIVSWAMRWSGRGCPAFEVYSDVRGNTGGSDCFIPWDGTDPFVGGFYGRTDAVVVVTGPKDMLCTVDDPTGRVSGGLSGGTIAQVARWAQTGSCILTIPVGDTVTVHLTDVHGGPIIGQRGVIRITAKPRSLTVG